MSKMASIVRKIISTTGAPSAIGPYSQGVLVGHTLYVSGQVGMDPTTKNLVEGGVEAETRQALNNMGAILKAAGSSFNNVVKCTVLLNDIGDFAKVNDVYKEFFPDKFPARAAYQVAKLPVGAKIEIEAVAVVGKILDSAL